jgi:hypothetical protein
MIVSEFDLDRNFKKYFGKNETPGITGIGFGADTSKAGGGGAGAAFIESIEFLEEPTVATPGVHIDARLNGHLSPQVAPSRRKRETGLPRSDGNIRKRAITGVRDELSGRTGCGLVLEWHSARGCEQSR